MFRKKQLHPDAAPATGGNDTDNPVKTRNIPKADTDFMDVAKTVAAKWLATPAITLLWAKADDFEKLVGNYEIALGGRKVTGSLRPGQTLSLAQMDTQMDMALKDVKVYIERKYKKANAAAQFARFGIIKTNKSWILSRDRNERRDALKQMIASIAADGFGNEEFGTAFWTDMQTNYSAALNSSSNIAGTVSSKVANKNEDKKEISKVLNGLLLVIKGNYPDTYKSVYRDWGWQKESY